MDTIYRSGFAELRADLLSVDLALAGAFPSLVRKAGGRSGTGGSITVDILVF